MGVQKVIIAGMIILALLSGCGLYDGLFNDPVTEEQNWEEPEEQECGVCAGFCMEGDCLGVVRLAAGALHNCALLESGQVACWGDNNRGQIGPDGGNFSLQPVLIPGLDEVTEVSLGWEFSCALRQGGDVWCWGDNGSLQLGGGDQVDNRAEPKAVSGLPQISTIATGYDHICAVRAADGGVLCWGGDHLGQLGRGEEHGDNNSLIVGQPTEVQGLDELSGAPMVLEAGWFITGLVGPEGDVWLWGDNEYGQLEFSDPQMNYSPAPQNPVPPGPVDDLALGWHHSCALANSGEVWCWGDNDQAQLSRTAGEVFDEPQQIQELSTSIIVDAGWGGHSCAALSQGGLICWGDNQSLQTGHAQGELIASDSQIVLSQEQLQQLALGHRHSCVLSEGKEVFCWGDNGRGQLGGFDGDSSHEPFRVLSP